MTHHPLPLLPTRRALVPGTRMTLPGSDRGWTSGDRVLVLHYSPENRPGSVGTIALIEAVEALGSEEASYTLIGELLVTIDPSDGVTRPVDTADGSGAEELIGRTQEALRAYMAALAEAGEDGDISVRLGSDPIGASHEVASYLRISWPEVQDLLEAGTAHDRLRRAVLVLQRETELLRGILGGKGTT